MIILNTKCYLTLPKKLKPESIKEVMKFIDYQKAKEEGDLNE